MYTSLEAHSKIIPIYPQKLSLPTQLTSIITPKNQQTKMDYQEFIQQLPTL